MLLTGWWWLLGRWAFWRLVASRLCSRWMAVGAAGNASHALLGWSSGFLGVPAASVFYQAWPLFALLLTGLLFHREGRFQYLDGRLAFLLLLGLGGVGMVVSGQVGELWFLSLGFAWSLAPGVTLALLSGIVGGSSVACTLRWAVDLSRGLGPRLLRGVSPSGLELPCTLLGYCVGQLLFLLPRGAVGLAAGDSFTSSLCLFGFLGGLALCCTSTLWQCANLLVVRRAGVNVLWYMAPAVALLWLFLAGGGGVSRWDWLLLGLSGLFAANFGVGVFPARFPGGPAPAVVALSLWLLVVLGWSLLRG